MVRIIADSVALADTCSGRSCTLIHWGRAATVIVSGDTCAGRPVLISRSSGRRRIKKRRSEQLRASLPIITRTGWLPGRAERLSPSRRCRPRLLLTEHSTGTFLQPTIIHVHRPCIGVYILVTRSRSAAALILLHCLLLNLLFCYTTGDYL